MGALHVYHNDVADILNVAVHGVGGHLLILNIVYRELVVFIKFLRFRYGNVKPIKLEQMLDTLLIKRTHTPGQNGTNASIWDEPWKTILGIVTFLVNPPAETVLRN